VGSVVGFPGIDPADVAVGARLRRWRVDRGAAIEDQARVLSITPEAVRRAEAGREHLNALQLAAATALLHLPVWALVSDTRAY
jgi:transcriptional regulator with XRE-family HTH domain